MYGTLKDFDALAAEGKKKSVRIIFDFVVNHSSDKHPCSSSRVRRRPTRSATGTSGATARTVAHPTTGYRLSAFRLETRSPHRSVLLSLLYAEQPIELAESGSAEAMYDATRFWYKRGVSGFGWMLWISCLRIGFAEKGFRG